VYVIVVGQGNTQRVQTFVPLWRLLSLAVRTVLTPGE